MKKDNAVIPCENCTRTGFPILFTRYGIAYSATNQGREALKKLEPKPPMQAVPGISTTISNVRMLRAGFLYLYLESEFGNEWKGYSIHPHGYVSEFAIESPGNAKAQKACQRGSHAANACLVWIEDAKHVKNIWYLFNPDPLDPQHLHSVIAPKRQNYMQKFSPQKWLAGDRAQMHSTTVSMLEYSVFEYAALQDERLVRCSESLIYGLMGSSAQERGWGDYEEVVEYDRVSSNPDAALMGVTEKDDVRVSCRQPDYATVHGPRLRQIKEFIAKNQGAVLACDDALGICQELGHQQAEGQMLYTAWQLSQASGHARGVTAEWVFQSALGAISMRDLIKKGAVKKFKDRQQMRKQMQQRGFPNFMDATFERELAVEVMERRRKGDPEQLIQMDARAKREAKQREQDRILQENRERVDREDLKKAQEAGDEEYARLFDQEAADRIIQQQAEVHRNVQQVLNGIGKDQVTWIKEEGLSKAISRYSDRPEVIDKPGGGAALSLQLAHCLAGAEGNAEGQKLLAELDPFGDNALSKLLSFNSNALKESLKAADAQAAQLPAPEASGWYQGMADVIKRAAAYMSLGDKALGFIDNAPQFSNGAVFRRMAWPAHVAGLLSVKMVQGINKLPPSQIEIKILRFAALTGLSTLGTTAADHAQKLVKAEKDRLRNAEQKFFGAAYRQSSARAVHGAPGARLAAFAGIFDIGNAVVGGFKLNAKRDARSAMEMLGNLLQGTGSILDYRAKAYEQTIYKGVRGVDVFNVKPMQESLDRLNSLQLRRMRILAVRFLLPAAVISIFIDSFDAIRSAKRDQYGLSVAQASGAIGTAFMAYATAAVAFEWGSAILISALGLIGAALAVAAIVAIFFLSEPEWVNWLMDIPLYKERKGRPPNHENLQETMQSLANARAGL